MRYIFAGFLLITLSAGSLSFNNIAVRHDVDERHFLELGAQYPSVVRVGENGGDGTLIAAEWVLTAGHVASGLSRRGNGEFKVFVDGQEEGYSVRQVVIHPDFKHMGPNDLGLIRLQKPVPGVTPTALYPLRDEQGKLIVLVGHGDTKQGTGGPWKTDRRKRGATNQIDVASGTHILFDFDPPEMATELEGTAGPGDSGGPAFIEIDGVPHVAGVSSMGQPGDNGPGTYGAQEHYVRVSSHIDWINHVISNPPGEKLVNMPAAGPSSGVVQAGPGSPGNLPPGVVLLEEIGLMVAERDGRVRMVGRIDELYPESLLNGGIRPPAILVQLNAHPITTAADLKTLFDGLPKDARFTLEFEHENTLKRFELVKQ